MFAWVLFIAGAIDCSAGLDRALDEIERSRPPARRIALLQLLAGETCSQLPVELRRAAGRAARADAVDRARILAEAARPFIDPSCATLSPAASAIEVSKKCPLPRELRANPTLIAKLDRATYTYVLALHRAFIDAGLEGEPPRRFLLDLLLASSFH